MAAARRAGLAYNAAEAEASVARAEAVTRRGSTSTAAQVSHCAAASARSRRRSVAAGSSGSDSSSSDERDADGVPLRVARARAAGSGGRQPPKRVTFQSPVDDRPGGSRGAVSSGAAAASYSDDSSSDADDARRAAAAAVAPPARAQTTPRRVSDAARIQRLEAQLSAAKASNVQLGRENRRLASELQEVKQRFRTREALAQADADAAAQRTRQLEKQLATAAAQLQLARLQDAPLPREHAAASTVAEPSEQGWVKHTARSATREAQRAAASTRQTMRADEAALRDEAAVAVLNRRIADMVSPSAPPAPLPGRHALLTPPRRSQAVQLEEEDARAAALRDAVATESARVQTEAERAERARSECARLASELSAAASEARAATAAAEQHSKQSLAAHASRESAARAAEAAQEAAAKSQEREAELREQLEGARRRAEELGAEHRAALARAAAAVQEAADAREQRDSDVRAARDAASAAAAELQDELKRARAHGEALAKELADARAAAAAELASAQDATDRERAAAEAAAEEAAAAAAEEKLALEEQLREARAKLEESDTRARVVAARLEESREECARLATQWRDDRATLEAALRDAEAAAARANTAASQAEARAAAERDAAEKEAEALREARDDADARCAAAEADAAAARSAEHEARGQAEREEEAGRAREEELRAAADAAATSHREAAFRLETTNRTLTQKCEQTQISLETARAHGERLAEQCQRAEEELELLRPLTGEVQEAEARFDEVVGEVDALQLHARRTTATLRGAQQLAQAIGGCSALVDVMDTCSDTDFAAAFGADASQLLLVDASRRTLVARCDGSGDAHSTVHVSGAEAAVNFECPLDTGLVGHVARVGRALLLRDALGDTRFDGAADAACFGDFVPRAMLLVPVRVPTRGVDPRHAALLVPAASDDATGIAEVVGVLALASARPMSASDEDEGPTDMRASLRRSRASTMRSSGDASASASARRRSSSAHRESRSRHRQARRRRNSWDGALGDALGDATGGAVDDALGDTRRSPLRSARRHRGGARRSLRDSFDRSRSRTPHRRPPSAAAHAAAAAAGADAGGSDGSASSDASSADEAPLFTDADVSCASLLSAVAGAAIRGARLQAQADRRRARVERTRALLHAALANLGALVDAGQQLRAAVASRSDAAEERDSASSAVEQACAACLAALPCAAVFLWAKDTDGDAAAAAQLACIGSAAHAHTAGAASCGDGGGDASVTTDGSPPAAAPPRRVASRGDTRADRHTPAPAAGGALRVPADSGVIGSVAASGRVVNVCDAHNGSGPPAAGDAAAVRSMLCVPVACEGSSAGAVDGVLQFVNRAGDAQGGAFSEADERLAAALSEQVGAVLAAQRVLDDVGGRAIDDVTRLAHDAEKNATERAHASALVSALGAVLRASSPRDAEEAVRAAARADAREELALLDKLKDAPSGDDGEDEDDAEDGREGGAVLRGARWVLAASAPWHAGVESGRVCVEALRPNDPSVAFTAGDASRLRVLSRAAALVHARATAASRATELRAQCDALRAVHAGLMEAAPNSGESLPQWANSVARDAVMLARATCAMVYVLDGDAGASGSGSGAASGRAWTPLRAPVPASSAFTWDGRAGRRPSPRAPQVSVPLPRCVGAAVWAGLVRLGHAATVAVSAGIPDPTAATDDDERDDEGGAGTPQHPSVSDIRRHAAAVCGNAVAASDEVSLHVAPLHGTDGRPIAVVEVITLRRGQHEDRVAAALPVAEVEVLNTELPAVSGLLSAMSLRLQAWARRYLRAMRLVVLSRGVARDDRRALLSITLRSWRLAAVEGQAAARARVLAARDETAVAAAGDAAQLEGALAVSEGARAVCAALIGTTTAVEVVLRAGAALAAACRAEEASVWLLHAAVACPDAEDDGGGGGSSAIVAPARARAGTVWTAVPHDTGAPAGDAHAHEVVTDTPARGSLMDRCMRSREAAFASTSRGVAAGGTHPAGSATSVRSVLVVPLLGPPRPGPFPAQAYAAEEADEVEAPLQLYGVVRLTNKVSPELLGGPTHEGFDAHDEAVVRQCGSALAAALLWCGERARDSRVASSALRGAAGMLVLPDALTALPSSVVERRARRTRRGGGRVEARSLSPAPRARASPSSSPSPSPQSHSRSVSPSPRRARRASPRAQAPIGAHLKLHASQVRAVASALLQRCLVVVGGDLGASERALQLHDDVAACGRLFLFDSHRDVLWPCHIGDGGTRRGRAAPAQPLPRAHAGVLGHCVSSRAAVQARWMDVDAPAGGASGTQGAQWLHLRRDGSQVWSDRAAATTEATTVAVPVAVPARDDGQLVLGVVQVVRDGALPFRPGHLSALQHLCALAGASISTQSRFRAWRGAAGAQAVARAVAHMQRTRLAHAWERLRASTMAARYSEHASALEREIASVATEMAGVAAAGSLLRTEVSVCEALLQEDAPDVVVDDSDGAESSRSGAAPGEHSGGGGGGDDDAAARGHLAHAVRVLQSQAAAAIGADTCVLWLADDEARGGFWAIRPDAGDDTTAAAAAGIERLPGDEGPVARVAASGSAVCVAHGDSDADCPLLPPREGGAQLFLPVPGATEHGSAVVGVLQAVSRANQTFDGADRARAEQFARSLGGVVARVWHAAGTRARFAALRRELADAVNQRRLTSVRAEHALFRAGGLFACVPELASCLTGAAEPSHLPAAAVRVLLEATHRWLAPLFPGAGVNLIVVDSARQVLVRGIRSARPAAAEERAGGVAPPTEGDARWQAVPTIPAAAGDDSAAAAAAGDLRGSDVAGAVDSGATSGVAAMLQGVGGGDEVINWTLYDAGALRDGLAGQVVTRRQAVLCASTEADPRVLGSVDGLYAGAEGVSAPLPSALAAAPVCVQGAVCMVLSVAVPPGARRSVSDDDLALVVRAAYLLEAALHQARAVARAEGEAQQLASRLEEHHNESASAAGAAEDLARTAQRRADELEGDLLAEREHAAVGEALLEATDGALAQLARAVTSTVVLHRGADAAQEALTPRFVDQELCVRLADQCASLVSAEAAHVFLYDESCANLQCMSPSTGGHAAAVVPVGSADAVARCARSGAPLAVPLHRIGAASARHAGGAARISSVLCVPLRGGVAGAGDASDASEGEGEEEARAAQLHGVLRVVLADVTPDDASLADTTALLERYAARVHAVVAACGLVRNTVLAHNALREAGARAAAELESEIGRAHV